jgi:hypothetical protein
VEKTSIRGVVRAARLLATAVVVLVCLGTAEAAVAAAPVRPALGRWEGRAGAAQVVFTVEETGHGARYLVRPVVYCDPGNSTFFETSLFNLSQPDAWPITSHGLLRNSAQTAPSVYSPLIGRFDTGRATLRLIAGGTCAAAGTRFTAKPQPAHPTVPDGDWTTQLSPHQNGLIGEFALIRTRGEGATIDSDWGVYDGLESCYFQRSPLELLVNADGSFDATINGNQLNSQNVTMHVEGSFLSANTLRGSYTLTGPGCTGKPVDFAAVLTSLYQPPNPVSGGVRLINPAHGPGPVTTTPPEAECRDLATISPRFAPEEEREIQLGSFSAGALPLKVSASIKLGSVGVCDRAIEAVQAGLTRTLSALDLEAVYKRSARKVNSVFRFTFVPLGWRLPGGTGARRPEPPVIDWPSADFTLPGGVETTPSLNFTYSPGKPVAPELELVKVPILQQTNTLIALARPFLSVRLGPELSLGLQLDEKEFDKDVNEAVAEGEAPAAAAEEIAQEAELQLMQLIDVEEGALEPGGQPPIVFTADATAISSTFATQLDIGLLGEAGTGPVADSLEASAVLRGLLGSPTFVSSAEEVVGDATIVLLEAASAHPSLPPGVHQIHGRPPVAGRLRAHPIRRLSRRALRRAPFPIGRIPTLVRGRFPLAAPARVGPLAATSRTLRPGGTVSVVAPFLGASRPHDGLLTLAGPGYRASRLLQVANGAAGATITLPRRLARGTWTISVEDRSGVTLAPDGHTLTGSAILRIGVFDVRR